jgi:hypothetical protein
VWVLTRGAGVFDVGCPLVFCRYYCILVVTVFMVIINTYIAVILENLESVSRDMEETVNKDSIRDFYEVWGRYDPMVGGPSHRAPSPVTSECELKTRALTPAGKHCPLSRSIPCPLSRVLYPVSFVPRL